MYIHFERVVCIGEDGREHTFSIMLGSDGSRKVQDWGVTYEWKKKEDAEKYLSFSVSVRGFVDNIFDCNDKCKSVIAQYLTNPIPATEGIFCEWMDNNTIFAPLRKMFVGKLDERSTRTDVARMLLESFLSETN